MAPRFLSRLYGNAFTHGLTPVVLSVYFDRSLYIPKKWRVGQGTIQPSETVRETQWFQTDSTDGLPSVDGETGQVSLERTDAKTALPSLSVMPQKPSAARKGHDTHGPLVRKEK